MNIKIEIDSDDDFIYSVGNNYLTTYSRDTFDNIEDAINYLKSLDIHAIYYWTKINHSFIKQEILASSIPADYFFLGYINEAINNLELNKGTRLGGNQTLLVTIQE